MLNSDLYMDFEGAIAKIVERIHHQGTILIAISRRLGEAVQSQDDLNARIAGIEDAIMKCFHGDEDRADAFGRILSDLSDLVDDHGKRILELSPKAGLDLPKYGQDLKAHNLAMSNIRSAIESANE